jgi:hypothetical protein
VCSSGSCLTIGFRLLFDSFGTQFRFLRDCRSGRSLTLCVAWAAAVRIWSGEERPATQHGAARTAAFIITRTTFDSRRGKLRLRG